MRFILYILIGSILLSCCKVAEKLSLERAEYLGNNLRIDGYYIYCGEEYEYPFVLYRNGLYLSFGSTEFFCDKILVDSLLSDENVIERVKRTQYGWGVFRVSGSAIYIEEWLPGTGGPYPTQLLSGRILNDTTIAISGLRGRKYAQKIDTFRFRHLSPKPDSTNMFIN